ncbi:hypothetical protein M885DRAFT_521285 [Pelagophyceae sp. CCMP2097]|nr:hypothetical protein M885DRAFT_521285 [Pelagophyceae sp. CCMP2097]
MAGRASKRLRRARAEARTGQWTDAEIAFANSVVTLFHAGSLPRCANGTTLRALLAELLHCSPMRISKKFSGDGALGKRVFKRVGSAQLPQPQLVRLHQLEHDFHESIDGHAHWPHVEWGTLLLGRGLVEEEAKMDTVAVEVAINVERPGAAPRRRRRRDDEDDDDADDDDDDSASASEAEDDSDDDSAARPPRRCDAQQPRRRSGRTTRQYPDFDDEDDGRLDDGRLDAVMLDDVSLEQSPSAPASPLALPLASPPAGPSTLLHREQYGWVPAELGVGESPRSLHRILVPPVDALSAVPALPPGASPLLLPSPSLLPAASPLLLDTLMCFQAGSPASTSASPAQLTGESCMAVRPTGGRGSLECVDSLVFSLSGDDSPPGDISSPGGAPEPRPPTSPPTPLPRTMLRALSTARLTAAVAKFAEAASPKSALHRAFASEADVKPLHLPGLAWGHGLCFSSDARAARSAEADAAGTPPQIFEPGRGTVSPPLSGSPGSNGSSPVIAHAVRAPVLESIHAHLAHARRARGCDDDTACGDDDGASSLSTESPWSVAAHPVGPAHPVGRAGAPLAAPSWMTTIVVDQSD